MDNRKQSSIWLLLVVLGVSFCLSRSQDSCPPLAVPSYGQLVYNNNDATQSQPQMYSINDTVEYRCAQGYELVALDSRMVLQQSVTTCNSNGVWSLLNVTCQYTSDDLNLLVPVRDAIIIIGAVLGAIILLQFLLIVCCLCWAVKLRAKTRRNRAEDEVAFVQSQGSGAFVVSNPLIVVRDDDSNGPGNPLYLTPAEMNEMEGNH